MRRATAITVPMDADPETLDLTGYRCPMPVIRLEAALRRSDEGAQLIVIADDPVAAVDIPLACRDGGHTWARLPDRDGVCVFKVTRGAKP